jgi:hypothetical protein
VSLSEIHLRFDEWRTADRGLGRFDPGTAMWKSHSVLVSSAQLAFLESVRVFVEKHRNVEGFPAVESAIQRLRDADALRTSSRPGSPEYREAAQLVRDANALILSLVTRDAEQREQEVRAAFRRLMATQSADHKGGTHK